MRLRQFTAVSVSQALLDSRVTIQVEGVFVRHSSSIPRAIVGVLAAFAGFALFACGVAAASITLFEKPLFQPGTVHQQSGVGGFPWQSSPPGAITCLGWPGSPPVSAHNGQYDQAVVLNGLAESVGFGAQSLRISNACASGEFFYQTYSPAELVQVSEARINKVFMAQFSFMAKTSAYQPGLFLSVSPDSHEGSRMSWVGLEDTPEGIRVTAADTPEVDGKFVYSDIALVNRTAPHTVRFWIEVSPGEDNDLVRIAVDGRDVGQCFATWESFYRNRPATSPPPNVNTPADINSLQFRSSVPGPPALATSGGYLFDSVSITPSNGPGPPACRDDEEVPPPIEVDKTTQTRSARPGDLVTYRITARNRSKAPVRDVRACDRAPRALTFVGATVQLDRATGRRRCLTIPLLRPGQRRTFQATFRLRENVALNTVENGAIVDIPAFAPAPLPPEASLPPDASASDDPGTRLPRRQIDRDAVKIRVRRGPDACSAALSAHARAAC